LVGICLLISAGIEVHSQDWAKSGIRNLHRVDLRQLGMPDVNPIPENSSAITSLCTAGDGTIYGGTTGDHAYLFRFDPGINKALPLGFIPGQESIHHALVEGGDRAIYLGTGRNPFAVPKLSPGGPFEQIDEVLWKDIQARFSGYDGGHLYRFIPAESRSKVKMPDMPADVVDLGIPSPGNSIYALAVSPDGETIYGLTYPDGSLFRYLLQTGTFESIGTADSKLNFHGPERHWRSLSRSLICDRSGRLFFSSTGGELKYYAPLTGLITETGLRIPADLDPSQFHQDYDVVEYFAADPKGVIYGGTSDGYLFRFDPETMVLNNLGKPRAGRRLRCLTAGSDGSIFLMAGERPETSQQPCKFYRYKPGEGFLELGLLIADRSPFYYRRGYQFDAMATGRDGTIYLGESERDSSLFLYIPEE